MSHYWPTWRHREQVQQSLVSKPEGIRHFGKLEGTTMEPPLPSPPPLAVVALVLRGKKVVFDEVILVTVSTFLDSAVEMALRRCQIRLGGAAGPHLERQHP